MADVYPPSRQRPRLLELVGALDASSVTLRRDECGDWTLSGKHGHIFAVPLDRKVEREGFQLVVFGETKIKWGNRKRALSFCALTQDGDTEGAFILDRLPTPKEADAIRQALGIKRRRSYSDEQMERLRLNAPGVKASGGVSGRIIDETTSPVATLPERAEA